MPNKKKDGAVISLKDKDTKPAKATGSTVPVTPSTKDREDAYKQSFFSPDCIDRELPDHHKENVTRQRALKALDTLRDFISSGGSITEETREEINRLLDDHANRVKTMIVGISQVRANNLSTLIRDIDALEQELASRNIRYMSTEQLINFYNTLTKREKELIDFLMKVSEVNIPKTLEGESAQEKAAKNLEELGVEVPNVAGRRNIREMMDRILRDLHTKK